MTEETPTTGDALTDFLLFAGGAVVFVGATLVGCHALTEAMRRRDDKGGVER